MPDSFPPVSAVRQADTHRLIPSQYSHPGESFLRVAQAEDDRRALTQLASYTSDIHTAFRNELSGISRQELVVNLPNADIVNATFCHARPGGGRFNTADRGAWYSAIDIQTALAEVIHHRTQYYKEINYFFDTVHYCDFLADFAGEFHDLRDCAEGFSWALDPDDYTRSQKLASAMLAAGSLGIIYPSVRHSSGVCIVCFRPAAVVNVRRGLTYQLTWKGADQPTISELSSAFAT